MAEEKKGGFCKSCEKQVVVFRKGTNHILHLLLTLFTFGLWLIVWFGSSVKFGGWRCTQCGSPKVNNVS
jgi:hypothetical protein